MPTRLFSRLCAVLIALSVSTAFAQSWPAKPVRVIIPAGTGGAVDTLGRMLAEKLSLALRQPFVVENMPGAGTTIGSEATAKAPPVGYTLLVMTNSHAVNAGVRSNLRYDPEKSFAPVSLLATLPDLLMVNQSVKATSVSELIELARKSPGKINFASAGAGSGTHLVGELFNSMARVQLVHVPYKSGTAALTDLAGGHVEVMFANPVAGLPHITSGRVRALGVTSTKRIGLMPDVPTIGESLPGFASNTWYGVLFPAATPGAIVDALNREIQKTLALPDVKKRIEGEGGDVVGSTPAEFARYLSADIDRWKKLVASNPHLRID